jgi:hypothetical protein
MKKILILALAIITQMQSQAQSQQQKTIAVLPAKVEVDGNIPARFRNDPQAFMAYKKSIAYNQQAYIANALLRQSRRNKNRKVAVQITAPQSKGYQATYVIAPRLSRTMIMNPGTAQAINMTAFSINMNTPINAPYVRPNVDFAQFTVIKAGTDIAVWRGRGNMNRQARQMYRAFRKGML